MFHVGMTLSQVGTDILEVALLAGTSVADVDCSISFLGQKLAFSS